MSATRSGTARKNRLLLLGTRGLLSFSLALLLTGCLVPWVYHQWPDFSGVITRGGTPIGDAKVRYSTDEKSVDCGPGPGEEFGAGEDKAFHYYSEDVTSSADGTFLFPGKRSFFYVWFIIPGIAEYIRHWHLCVRTLDGQLFEKEVSVGWGGMWAEIPERTPDSVMIIGTCDVTSREVCRTR